MIELLGLRGFDSCLNLPLVNAQGLTETFVKFEWDDGFRQLIQVSTEDVGGVVYRVSGPIQALSITFWGVEYFLEVFDTFRGTIESEDTFHIRSYRTVSACFGSGDGDDAVLC